MNLIGISGLAGSGKDTAANFFIEEFGFASVAFADPMKRICMDVFDWDEETLWGPSEKRSFEDKRFIRVNAEEKYPAEMHLYLTPRYALQELGTTWGRGCYKDIWVDYAVRVSRKILSSPGAYAYTKSIGLHEPTKDSWAANGVVFSDCRFENEMKIIVEEGATLIRVKKDDAGLSGKEALHQSESEQLKIPDNYFDYVIDNNSSIDDLRKRVLEIGKELGFKRLKSEKQLEFKWT